MVVLVGRFSNILNQLHLTFFVYGGFALILTITVVTVVVIVIKKRRR